MEINVPILHFSLRTPLSEIRDLIGICTWLRWARIFIMWLYRSCIYQCLVSVIIFKSHESFICTLAHLVVPHHSISPRSDNYWIFRFQIKFWNWDVWPVQNLSKLDLILYITVVFCSDSVGWHFQTISVVGHTQILYTSYE